MSFTPVQSNTSLDSNAVTLTGVGAGNLIVIWFKAEGTIGTPTCSDGTSSLEIRPNNTHAGGINGFYAYLLSANSGGRTYTFTPGGSPSFQRIIVWEFSYTGGAATFDTDIATADGTSTAPNSGNITTTGTDELVFGAYGENGDSLLSSRLINGSAATANTDAGTTSLWYRAFNATFTGAASATLGPSADWICSAIAFKIVVAATIEQEGFLWRADDGSESSATALASQDANITRSTGNNTRLRVLLNASDDPATATYQLESKLSGGSYAKVPVVGSTALAFGTIGTVTTTGTTAPTVAYPASIAAGDLLILAVANRPNASTPSTPADWTAPTNSTATGGAGSEAAGTGTVRLTVFTKIATGAESGTLGLTITSGTSCGAAMWRVTKDAGKVFAVALVNGSDNSAGTSWSATMGSDPGVTSGDLVFVASASSEDTASFASEALSQTGVTYGTMAERADSAISTGNDLRLVISEHPITSGTSSAAAVYTMTASGTNSANAAGVSTMIRVRQNEPPIKMSASSNITASGENTTAQLSAPSGKSTSDFVAGRVQDDENPADTVDITTDDYTEMEWCITATTSATDTEVYEFRVTNNGAALSTYTVTPQWTIGTPSSGGAVKKRKIQPGMRSGLRAGF